VSKLFTKIGELVEEEGALVFVLIDEVESLTSARKVRRRRLVIVAAGAPWGRARARAG
jgi:hypothetical protein